MGITAVGIEAVVIRSRGARAARAAGRVKGGAGCIDEAKRREPRRVEAQRGGAEGRSLPLRRGDPGLGEEGGHAGRG
jgi:hypothetical protein